MILAGALPKVKRFFRRARLSLATAGLLARPSPAAAGTAAGVPPAREKSGASASPGLQQRNFNGQARTSPLGLSGTRLRTGKERKQGNRSPRVGVIRNRGDLLLSPSSAGERG